MQGAATFKRINIIWETKGCTEKEITTLIQINSAFALRTACPMLVPSSQDMVEPQMIQKVKLKY